MPRKGLLCLQERSLIMNNVEKELYTTAEAAAYLGTTPKSLTVMRCTGAINIPVIQWGKGNRIRFQKADLDKWIESQRKDK